MDSSIDDLFGKVLEKKYILLTILGKGSYAVVWLAYDIKSNRCYAIKIHNTNDEDEAEHEIEMLKLLKKNKCPNIIHMFNYFTYTDDYENEHICIVLELMACNLGDLLSDKKFKHGLSTFCVKKIIYRLLQTLNHLHKNNLVHTDIKPENILLVGTSTKHSLLIQKIKQFNYSKILLNNKTKTMKGLTNYKNINEISQKKTLTQFLTYIQNFTQENYFNDDTSDNSSLSNKSNQKKNNNISRDIISDSESYSDSESDSDLESESDSESKSESKYEFKKKEDKKNSEYECIVADEIIKKCEIKISDFGSCKKIEDVDCDIQTRYYRAPEIILDHDSKHKYKCDIWSVGCVIYELLTGSMLFNPIKDNKCNRDKHHIHDIIELLGMPELNLFSDSRRYRVFFKKNGLLKGFKSIQNKDIKEILIKKTSNAIADQDLTNICDLIIKTLILNPDNRYDALKCLQHNLFEK